MNEMLDDTVENTESEISVEFVAPVEDNESVLQLEEDSSTIQEFAATQDVVPMQEPEHHPQKNKVFVFIQTIGHWLFFLRKIFLAIPVVYAAVRLALSNSVALPEFVGLLLQADGSFLVNMPRTIAVIGPLALTGGCLLMMFLSRKSLYAWAISIFSLTLPVLLLVSNIFPA